MATKVSDKYLQKVDVHMLQSIPIQHLNMTQEGKERLLVCKEVYLRFVTNPMLNIRQYIRGRWPDRTPSEIMNDIAVINHITAACDTGIRSLEKAKVGYLSDQLAQQGISTGDSRAIKAAADIKIKIHNLDTPDSQMEAYDNVADLPIAITDDVSVAKPGYENYSNEEKLAMLKKYGASTKLAEELLSTATDVYEIIDEEPERDAFIDNEEIAGR